MSNAYRCLRISGAVLALVAVMGISAHAAAAKQEPAPGARQKTLLDADWKFHRGDVDDPSKVIAGDFDDSGWNTVQIPHDYILDGKYVPPPADYVYKEADLKSTRRHGFLKYEPAWYRKRFIVPQGDEGKTLWLEFGGVYRDAKVWLNGKLLGAHPCGYIGFYFDISKAVRYGEENVITVSVDPRDFEGWWYEGGGIYRHVYYTAMSPVHVARHGTYVVSTVPGGNEGASKKAEITIETTIRNDYPHDGSCEIISEIIAPDGTIVAKLSNAHTFNANSDGKLVQKTTIKNPKLWSTESPNLYRLRTSIEEHTTGEGGNIIDTTTTTFGIRTIYFDKDKGFFLNGKHTMIYGAANHLNFPAVGIGMPDSLHPWRIKRLKEFGFNGWRTSHYDHGEAVLDACDEMGMLVMAEARHFGNTEESKSPPGTPFDELPELVEMIKQNRNHPSIIIWSMYNEEKLASTPEGAKIFRAMKKETLKHDATRPVTGAHYHDFSPNGAPRLMDVLGINYNFKRNGYAKIRERYPNKPFLATETLHERTTRGIYANDPVTAWADSYNLPILAWQEIASRPYFAGVYIWTGFDYRGEPNPYGWPAVNNNNGAFDMCGFPKDKAFYLKSCWTTEPMVHLLPMNWNLQGREGEDIRVMAVSNAKEVEIFLNGKSLGVKEVPKDGAAEWQVPYAPGTLSANAITDGKVTATDKIETTGKPAAIRMFPDRTELKADNRDALVVPISILDSEGRVVPDAANRVTFELVGEGRILGVHNGNPSDHDPDRADNRRAFNGYCMVLIQPGAKSGTIKLTATSPGLKPSTMIFTVK